MEKTIAKSLKVCENTEELIKSDNFFRAFEMIIKSIRKPNEEYFMTIMYKIVKDIPLGKQEKLNMLLLFEDGNFQRSAGHIYSKIFGFTLEDAVYFLKNYPIVSILDTLKEKAVGELEETIKIEQESTIEIGEEVFYKLVNGKTQAWIKNGDLLGNQDFVFTTVGDLNEVGGKIIYNARIGSENAYIERGKEVRQENVIKGLIWDIEEVYGKLVYKSKEGNHIVERVWVSDEG